MLPPKKMMAILCFLLMATVAFNQTITLNEHKNAFKLYPDLLLANSSLETYAVIKGNFDANFQAWEEKSIPKWGGTTFWGKLVFNNEIEKNSLSQEWILSFGTEDISFIDLYAIYTDTTLHLRSGSALPLHLQHMRGHHLPNLNDFLIRLPANESVAIYFRIEDTNHKINHDFQPVLYTPHHRQQQLFNRKWPAILIIGAIGIMLFYNLFLLVYLRERVYAYYLFYLFSILVYVYYSSFGYLTNSIEQLIFPYHPEWRYFFRLNYYFIGISYLAFLIAFLDLKQLLPFWYKMFNSIIILGVLFFAIDAYQLYANSFNLEKSNQIFAIYLACIFLCATGFTLPLYKTKSHKAPFIILSIAAIIMGGLATLINLIVGKFTTSNLFLVETGMVVEIILFSAGLAYQQRMQEREKMLALQFKEIDELKSRFYTNLTHEFRTPLTVILGMTEQLDKKAATPEKKLIEAIQRNGSQMLQLINQMLDLSRLEAKKINLKLIQRDIIPFLKYLMEAFESYAENKNIQLHFLSTVDELQMDYDPQRLQQIIANLLSNSIKFTPNGGNVYLQINISENGESLAVKVKDTGIGISEAQIPLLFERFYKGRIKGSGDNQSSGIGLSLVRELVNLMNGEITVRSKEAEGTEFTLKLPIHQQAPKVMAETTVSIPPTLAYEDVTAASSLHPTNGPTILIVEDNLDIIQYLKTCLQGDYQLEVARNGIAGLNLAIKKTPDLIISDVMMPQKNGFELCHSLKNDVRTSHIPIILLTAKADMESKLIGLEAGADAYLYKPFSEEELKLRIYKLISMRNHLKKHYTQLVGVIKAQGSEGLVGVAPSSKEEQFLGEVKGILQKHYDDPSFKVKQLCSKMNMSYSQFHRKLTALTGYSGNHFIRLFRMQKAIHLLQDIDCPIYAVAYDCGFSDPEYFSRLFKKEYGVNPSEWRSAHVKMHQ